MGGGWKILSAWCQQEGEGGLTKVSADILKKLMLKQRGKRRKNIIQAKKRETVEDVRIYYSKFNLFQQKKLNRTLSLKIFSADCTKTCDSKNFIR